MPGWHRIGSAIKGHQGEEQGAKIVSEQGQRHANRNQYKPMPDGQTVNFAQQTSHHEGSLKRKYPTTRLFDAQLTILELDDISGGFRRDGDLSESKGDHLGVPAHQALDQWVFDLEKPGKAEKQKTDWKGEVA